MLNSRRLFSTSRRLGGASLALGLVMAIGTAQPALGANTATVAQADPAVQAGQAVIIKANCGGCHTIPGVPGAVGTFGPNLGPTDSLPPVSGRDMIASYPNGAVPNGSPDDLAAWIQNAPSQKPGTQMPNLGLSSDDAAAAAAYLYAIQPDGSVAGADNGDGSGG